MAAARHNIPLDIVFFIDPAPPLFRAATCIALQKSLYQRFIDEINFYFIVTFTF